MSLNSATSSLLAGGRLEAGREASESSSEKQEELGLTASQSLWAFICGPGAWNINWPKRVFQTLGTQLWPKDWQHRIDLELLELQSLRYHPKPTESKPVF